MKTEDLCTIFPIHAKYVDEALASNRVPHGLSESQYVETLILDHLDVPEEGIPHMAEYIKTIQDLAPEYCAQKNLPIMELNSGSDFVIIDGIKYSYPLEKEAEFLRAMDNLFWGYFVI